MKHSLSLLIGLLISSISFTNSSLFHIPVKREVEQALLPHAIETDTLLISAVGDIMPGSNFPSPAFLPPVISENLLAPASVCLQKADLAFGNLEGTILDTGGIPKKCRDTSACYLFRIPTRLAPYLKTAGFDALSLANNHSGDFGVEGRNCTIHTLDSLQIGYCGLLVSPYTIVERKGIKYGVISFAPNSGTLNLNNTDSIKLMVSMLRPICDILLVSFHGGAEGRAHQHVPRQMEKFYGEDRGNVYEVAHAAIDAGADLVIGQGPHVPRAFELYKDKFIAYSLGNFCTYNRFSLKYENSYAPLLNVYVNLSGKFLKAQVISFRQLGEGGPSYDSGQSAFKQIRMLTASDFPETALRFQENGDIYPVPTSE